MGVLVDKVHNYAWPRIRILQMLENAAPILEVICIAAERLLSITTEDSFHDEFSGWNEYGERLYEEYIEKLLRLGASVHVALEDAVSKLNDDDDFEEFLDKIKDVVEDWIGVSEALEPSDLEAERNNLIEEGRIIISEGVSATDVTCHKVMTTAMVFIEERRRQYQSEIA